MLRWTKRVLGGLLGGLLSLSLGGLLYQAIGTALDEQRYQPPGQLIEVNGSVMHLSCAGEGSPTVVMESGGAAWSLDWSRVQPEIAKLTRACSYDRAGVWLERTAFDAAHQQKYCQRLTRPASAQPGSMDLTSWLATRLAAMPRACLRLSFPAR